MPNIPLGRSGKLILSPAVGISPPFWICEYRDLDSEGVVDLGV